jgi:very-short-patch-repair endonuclease
MEQVMNNQNRQIIYYYQRGVASYLIAKKLGISNTKVRAILKKHNVSLRSHDVTNKVSAAKRTPAENRAITKKASETNLGSIHSNLHRVRLAASRQKNPKIDPVYELPLLRACQELSIIAIPQKSFYKYNVDLYLPKENVVIEIFGGNFHNKPDAVILFENKIKYLSSKRVPVVVVWADKLTYSPQAVLEVAMRATDRLTIIDGTGTLTTRGVGAVFKN